MAIDGHSCEGETDDWLLGDGQEAVLDFLEVVREHNAVLALRDAGVPLPTDHCSGDVYVSELMPLHPLPLDVVSKVIWPLLFPSKCHLENFYVCATLRCVSQGWREYVDMQREWSLGLLAHARHRDRVLEEINRATELTTDSEPYSDSEIDEDAYWEDTEHETDYLHFNGRAL